MHPTEIFETGTIAKPSSHLHQRVVHARVAIHVADGQSIYGQSTRKTEATDGDRGEPNPLLLIPLEIQKVVSLAVHDIQAQMIEDAIQGALDIAPVETAVYEVTVEHIAQRCHVLILRRNLL